MHFLTVVAAVAAPLASSTQAPFLVMGDWGGQTTYPYTTPAEIATATGMGKIANSLSSTFGLALGDNFYTQGVKNVDDTRFQHTFENVFTADSLQAPHFTFNVLAGNHDHNGNVTAQVSYSGRSKRWSFPSLYYTFTEGDVQFVMIDTVVLSGNSDLDDGTELDGDQLPGPESMDAADAQLAWIETTLSNSNAKYLVVGGHYPVYSICEHGPTAMLQDQLKPLLEQYNVSAYMNGHDHCAQLIDVGDGVQYHTIGSAHYNDPSTAHASTVSSDQVKFHVGSQHVLGGFASVSVDSTGMTVVHRDGDGNVLYTAPTIAPRR